MGKKVHKAACVFGAKFMLEQVKRLEGELENALEAKDIEGVHQMRVASRRLRNAFGYFQDCLPGKKAKTWQDEIRKITKSLGRARDLDIQIECINDYYDDTLDAQYKPGYRRFLLRLKQNRVKAQEKVEKTLKKLQDGSFLSEMHQRFEKLSAKAEGTYLFTPSLYQMAFEAINEQLEEFLGYQEFIRDPENIEKLHAMRIAGKHLRYTMELFAPIYKEALIPHIRVMKDLQDQLGTIHDADVWVSWLPKFIEKERSRIEDYFGNVGPLKRLLPGFEHFIENRQQVRQVEYDAFLSTWVTLADENAWSSLKEIIKTPINVEAALIHLSTNDQDKTEEKTSEEIPEEEDRETTPDSEISPEPGNPEPLRQEPSDV